MATVMESLRKRKIRQVMAMGMVMVMENQIRKRVSMATVMGSLRKRKRRKVMAMAMAMESLRKRNRRQVMVMENLMII